MQKLLVVAAHADDEILGAGGTLAAAARAGHPVRVVILSVASSSRDGDESALTRLREGRVRAAMAAAELGGWSVALHDYPDNAFDRHGLLELTQTIEREVRAFAPTAVLSHYPGDISRDHQLTSAAVSTAVRPTGTNPAPDVAYFEIRSSTEWGESAAGRAFQPTLWVPLDEWSWSIKVRALALYADELRPWPHPRSQEGVDALARYRGSQIGMERAEAFALARGIARFQG